MAWFGRIPAIFLYLPEVAIYPPQLNHFHNLRLAENDDESEASERAIFRFSSWTQSLGEEWITAADYTLVEDQWLDGWVSEAVAKAGLQELAPSPLPEACRPSSKIHVFKQP